MAKLISPAVSTKEIDLSFVPQAVASIGAGLIGLASKGPAFVPTSINTFSQYRNIFGDTNKDNFMRYAAKEYLKNQGQLTVVRVLGQTSDGVDIDNGWTVMATTGAIGSAQMRTVLRKTDNSVTGLAVAGVNGKLRITASYSGGASSQSADVTFDPQASDYIGRVFPTSRQNVRTTGGTPSNVGVTYGLYADTIVKQVPMSVSSCTAISISTQKAGYKYKSAETTTIISQGYGPSGSASVYDLFKVVHIGAGIGTNTDVKIEISNIVFDDTQEYPNFVLSVRRFDDTDSSPNVIESFSVNLDPNSDDYILKVVGDRYRKIVTTDGDTPYIKTYGDWDNKSQYIRIAHPDSTQDTFVAGLPSVPSNARPQGFKGFYMGSPVVNRSGSYVPTIEYVTSQKRRTNYNDVTATGEVTKKITLGYDFTRMDNSFLEVQNHLSTSAQRFGAYQTLGFYIKPTSTDRTPSVGSYQIRDLTAGGSDVSSTLIAGGSESNVRFALPLYRGNDGWDLNTTDTPQEQVMNGSQASRLNNAIDLFANADQIDVNMLAMPGICSGNNGQQINRLIDLCSARGDCFAIVDIAKASSAASATLDDAINTTITEAADQADGFDDSYAAMFWPWIRVKDSSTNELVWLPPSVAAYGAIAYNDKVAHPWFAAAGFKRGLLDFVVEARVKLTKDHRDTLYDKSINPIATIKDQILIFGNRTSQKKNTSLRGLDVRRGLIDMKKLIVSVAQYVLFDKNTIRRRDEFIGKVTPILETMQSQEGLNAFRIVSNPTNQDIDRSILPMTIYVQFTKRIEFIPIDVIITPTGIQF